MMISRFFPTQWEITTEIIRSISIEPFLATTFSLLLDKTSLPRLCSSLIENKPSNPRPFQHRSLIMVKNLLQAFDPTSPGLLVDDAADRVPHTVIRWTWGIGIKPGPCHDAGRQMQAHVYAVLIFVLYLDIVAIVRVILNPGDGKIDEPSATSACLGEWCKLGWLSLKLRHSP